MRMSIYPISQATRRRGFTLVEILVIAALIGLFSTIAIFSTQYLVDSSKRKAAIMDLRTIGNTLAVVKMDSSMFPKIGYLSFSRESLASAGLSNPDIPFWSLPPDFDAMGFYETPAEATQREGPNAKRILDEWIGPYIPSSLARSLIGPRGFTVRMRMPTVRTIPGRGSVSQTLDWPADPWGNPYVIYLVKLEWVPSSASYEPYWILKSTEEATFKAIVVSYGPNGIPGGYADPSLVSPAQKVAAEDFKLYKKDGNDFVALLLQEYELDNAGNPQNRLEALATNPGSPQPNAYRTAMGDPEFPGVIDPGSDDYFYEIPSK